MIYRPSCLILSVATAICLILPGCGCSRDKSDTSASEHAASELGALPDSVPEDGFVKMKIYPIGGSLARVFNDLNQVHVDEAKNIGISPIESPRSAWQIKRPIKHIESCDEYFVDNLTHSVPYLVPEASSLLKEIGQRFNDSLQARGGGNYKLKVTSVLRTRGAVKKLRKRNINATEESAHQFGTTFDISYAKFICDSMTVARTQEDLKNLLGEVLKQLRDEQKRYVKYERKQGCFHITARKYKQ